MYIIDSHLKDFKFDGGHSGELLVILSAQKLLLGTRGT